MTLKEKIKEIFPPDYYSYYVANSSQSNFNGHWQVVYFFEGIPEELREVKGAWRSHYYDERIYDLFALLK